MFKFKFYFLAVFINFSQSESNICGLNDIASGFIVGGSEVSKGNWPWLVALFRADTYSSEFFCGATLISKRHLITAAHCMHEKSKPDPTKPSEFVAYLGRHELSKPFESESQIAYPSKVIVHPDWNAANNNYDADISIIFLSGDVTFNSKISPVCLWGNPSRNLTTLAGIVTGWGQTSQDFTGKPSNTPRQVGVSIVKNEKCFREHYQLTFLSSERTFCARGKIGSGPCLGDSGGGFYAKDDKHWFLRGIISSSLLTSNKSCDVTVHAVYTNIFDYSKWIVDSTGIKMFSPSPEFEIISRAMWGAQPPKPDIIYLTPPSKRIMISHTVTEDCFDLRDCILMMQSIQEIHKESPVGYNDIYCNFFIGGDGLVFEGRGWKIRGEHTVSNTRSHNDAICVAFIGDFRNTPPKQSNIDAFFELLADGVATGMLEPDYVINAQRDFHSSVSPGDAFYNIIKTWPKFRNTL